MTGAEVPPTRWAQGGQAGSYAAHFARLIESGTDIDGEARLADALAPRNARILDAGAGIGRVAGALAARGHEVVAVEPDPGLVTEARRRYPDLEVLEADILQLDPQEVGTFDLVVCVGNVMILLAEDTERRVLGVLGDLLRQGGRLLLGFATTAGPGNSREYPYEEFVADAEAAGLTVQHRFGTYELDPPARDYVVVVLTR